MSRLGKTAESLLSDVFIKLVISAAIEQHHLHESIFRLFTTQEIFVEILGGNKAGSRNFRDKPPFPHQISPLVSARRA